MLSEIISATTGGVLSALIVQFIRLSRLDGLQRARVFETTEGHFNLGFYEYFKKQLKQAKSEIIVTGEGFTFKSKDGVDIAEGYHSGMIEAMERGVHVTRIQTARPLHPLWADKLKECLRRYPNNFHLYIIDNNEFQDITSVCIIDADTRNNVVEMMISSESDLQDSAVRLASAAVFLHGRRALALSVRANTLAIKHYSITKKCSNPEDVDEFLKRA